MILFSTNRIHSFYNEAFPIPLTSILFPIPRFPIYTGYTHVAIQHYVIYHYNIIPNMHDIWMLNNNKKYNMKILHHIVYTTYGTLKSQNTQTALDFLGCVQTFKKNKQ
jgi:hypothetical protein